MPKGLQGFQKRHIDFRKNIKPSFYKECLNCNKKIKVSVSHYKRGNGKYCSHKCRLEYWKKTGLLKGRTAWNKGKLSGKFIKCIVCKKEFYLQQSQLKRNIKTCSYECRDKNRIIWNKGLTKETDKRVMKYANSQKGRKSTSYWLGKKRLHMSGEKHWFWKGGITEENYLIRQSPEYKNWRRTVYIKDEYTCQECGQKHIDIVAHHIKPFSEFPELRFAVDNGIVLCRKCHSRLELSLRQED